MEIGVRDLRNRTGRVIDAVRAGEWVPLTVRGEAVADIVPHSRSGHLLQPDQLRTQFAGRSADAAVQEELDDHAGQTQDEP
jgi:prevent-host-death family protein